MNNHYKNRYDKFIKSVQAQINRKLTVYTEDHHIQPRCLKGNDNQDNLITLTLREHFLAHWMLWKAYPNYLPLASAFLQMNNKNPKLKEEFQGRITSRTYEKLRTETYKMLGEINKDKVNVRDENGNKLRISREEYKNSSYTFHTKGKIYVLDTEQNKWVYIDSNEYQNNKNRYKSRMSLDGFFRSGNPNPNINLFKYCFLDLETNQIIKITKLDAKKKNTEFGYKRLKQIQKKKLKCIDIDGNIVHIPLEQYDPSIHRFHLKGTVNVFDLETKTQKIISLEEYYLNRNRYQTSTKGKVLAKDKLGNTCLVGQKEFKSGEYVGQTKGLRMMFDQESGKFVQITQDEYQNNKNRYVGPNVGKINVIDKKTGVRSQILKNEFDAEIYLPLGNKKYLFLCQNRLTLKEKLINIYEWKLVKDEYEVIDQEKFEALKCFI